MSTKKGFVKLHFLKDYVREDFTIKKGDVIDTKKEGHKPLITDGIAEYVESIEKKQNFEVAPDKKSARKLNKTVSQKGFTEEKEAEWRIQRDIEEMDRELGINNDDLIGIDNEHLKKLRIIPILNGKKQIAILRICGKNTFEIKSRNVNIYPETKAGNATWFSSDYWRRKIVKRLIEGLDIKEKEAEGAVNTLCADAQNRIKVLSAAGAFKKTADEDSQAILDSIRKVEVVKSEDANVYMIYIDDAIINITDNELYSGAKPFCVQFLNRFLKKIKISGEEWDQIFIPHILSEDVLKSNGKNIESKGDIAVNKFFQYIHSKPLFDWLDMEKRIGCGNSIFLDNGPGIVWISTEFVNTFFEGEKIEVKLGVSRSIFASYLERTGALLEKGRSGKVGKKVKTFWHFNPEKIDISPEEVIKETKETTDTTLDTKLKGIGMEGENNEK